ncbi:MAG: lipoyl(octanoyl) transferase LipB [Planctomycetes bacterium]|nr:lipoyl(octanoyl) transferase LipB [Planctomycetota bacterium]
MDERALEVRTLGRTPYEATLDAMRAATDAVATGQEHDQLWLTEHESVYTAGRRTDSSDWVAPGTNVIAVERGGRITWHGPGQLVAYPIVRLSGKGRDLHAWLRLLEDVIIGTLAEFGIVGERDPDGTGVFVERRKIASIGIAVRRWVALHGLALNVDSDLTAFAAIRPCGFDATRMTSIAHELAPARAPDTATVQRRLVAVFRERWAAYPR